MLQLSEKMKVVECGCGERAWNGLQKAALTLLGLERPTYLPAFLITSPQICFPSEALMTMRKSWINQFEVRFCKHSKFEL